MNNDLFNIEELYCPITKQIFLYPVTAADGHTYEEYAIADWFKTHDTSPMTGTKISKELNKNRFISSIIDKLLMITPELKQEQYDGPHVDPLMGYLLENRILKLPSGKSRKTIVEDDEKAIYMFDNNIYTQKKGKSPLTIITAIFEYSSKKVIDYVLSRYSDPNMELNTMHPLRCAAAAGNIEIVQRLIDMGWDVNYVDKDQVKLLSTVIRCSKPEMLEYLLEAGLDIKKYTPDEIFGYFKTLLRKTDTEKKHKQNYKFYEIIIKELYKNI